MAKKDKTAKLPKKVGGVKLSKQLRKSAGVMAEIAQSPVAREVVSAALVAGASALARRKANTAAPDAKKPVGGDLDALISQGKEVGSLITQGINAFVSALLKPAQNGSATGSEVAGAAGTPTAAPPADATPTSSPGSAKPAAGTSTPAKPPARRAPAAARRTPATKPRGKPGPKPRT